LFATEAAILLLLEFSDLSHTAGKKKHRDFIEEQSLWSMAVSILTVNLRNVSKRIFEHAAALFIVSTQFYHVTLSLIMLKIEFLYH